MEEERRGDEGKGGEFLFGQTLGPPWQSVTMRTSRAAGASVYWGFPCQKENAVWHQRLMFCRKEPRRHAARMEKTRLERNVQHGANIHTPLSKRLFRVV